MAAIKKLQKEFKFAFPFKRIRIFPDRDLRASILEMSMIDTRIFQRLRNTKQLGNSNISYPTAEHSRFSHSLGVLYWSSKILAYLKDNHNASNNLPKLEEMNESVRTYLKEKLPDIPSSIFTTEYFLGLSWFEQLVRMYALLHDLSHVPFGHTLEDQAKLFERHDDDIPRLKFVFDKLKKEVEASYHFKDIQFGSELTRIAIEYISMVEDLFVIGNIIDEPKPDDPFRTAWLLKWKNINGEMRKPLLLTYDIVSNTICADLMDYTLRDTLFASMPKTFDKALLTCMKVVDYKTVFYEDSPRSCPMYRLGVSISRKKIRHDTITAILDLLRIRYDLTEKVYYHHTKVIADAMLEKIIRTLPTKEKSFDFTKKEIEELEFTPQDIYEKYLGDEGFLFLLESKLKSNEKLTNSRVLLDNIHKRNLYKAVFRVNKNEPLSEAGKLKVLECKSPLGRDAVERSIVQMLSQKYDANIEEGDVIISYPPEKMQKKVAKALIEWTDAQIFPFEKLPMEANYSNEVGLLTDRYQSLWAMTIYLNPSKIHYVRLAESVCEHIFDVHNDPVLKHYLKAKYEKFYDTSAAIADINHKVLSLSSNSFAAKTAKGESNLDVDTKVEIVEDAFITTIESRKKSKKYPKKKPSPDNEDSNNNPKLEFTNPDEA